VLAIPRIRQLIDFWGVREEVAALLIEAFHATFLLARQFGALDSFAKGAISS
jgi:hypothetical protein